MAHTSKTRLRGGLCTALTRNRVNDNPVIRARGCGSQSGEESYSYVTLIRASLRLETASFFVVAVVVRIQVSIMSSDMVFIVKSTEASGWKESEMLCVKVPGVLPERHHWRFCCYPCWAPISPAPPATGKQAFVLCGWAACVFLNCLWVPYSTCKSFRKQDAVVKSDNGHKLSHTELSSCLVGILWHPQCAISVSCCLFDMVKKKNPPWIHS